MIDTKPAKRFAYALVIYSVTFLVAWAVLTMLVFPAFEKFSPWVYTLLTEGIIKALVWTVPAMLLVTRFKDHVYVSLKGMFTARVNWFKYLPVFAFFTLYLLASSYVTQGAIAISADFDLSSLIMVVFVGITEEMALRGWLLNATVSGASKKKTWGMVILNALFFLVIHFPRWIHEGVFISSFTDLSFLCIIMLGIIFGRVFINSKSIVVPIALHMYWDLLALLL